MCRRTPRARFPALVAGALSLCTAVAGAQSPSLSTPISVSVGIPPAPEAVLTVSMEGDFGEAPRLEVRCAPSAVGAYRPFGFWPCIRALRAFDSNGAPIETISDGAGHWEVRGRLGRLSWKVDAAATERGIDDLNVSTHRRDGYTLLSGYATYLIVEGAERRPYTVRYALPKDWRIATSLPLQADGSYRAEHVLELLDEPAMLGTRFVSAEVKHPHVPSWIHVFDEGGDVERHHLDSLAMAQGHAASAVAALGWPKLSRPYHVFSEAFQTGDATRFGWALEHGHSFQGNQRAGTFKSPKPPDWLLYHATHHLLHAWIPRQLFSEELDPWRQLEGTVSGFVWFAEGFAQYLAYQGLTRSGALSPETALAMLVRRFATPAQRNLPPAPSPLIALSEAICRGDHAHWSNHYALGGLFALWLDQKLAAAGRPDLNAVLRRLHELHRTGFSESGFEDAFSQASGLDVTPLLAIHVRGSEPPPLNVILEPLGVTFPSGHPSVQPAERVSPDVRRLRDRLFPPSIR